MARPRGPYVRGAGVRTAAPCMRKPFAHRDPMTGRTIHYLETHHDRERFSGHRDGAPIDHDERIEVTRVRERPRLKARS